MISRLPDFTARRTSFPTLVISRADPEEAQHFRRRTRRSRKCSARRTRAKVIVCGRTLRGARIISARGCPTNPRFDDVLDESRNTVSISAAGARAPARVLGPSLLVDDTEEDDGDARAYTTGKSRDLLAHLLHQPVLSISHFGSPSCAGVCARARAMLSRRGRHCSSPSVSITQHTNGGRRLRSVAELLSRIANNRQLQPALAGEENRTARQLHCVRSSLDRVHELHILSRMRTDGAFS